MPAAPEILVVNTGPLVALGRVQAFDVISALPIKFITPAEVADEIAAGVRLGHAVELPAWVDVVPVPGGVRKLNTIALDEGEAAVIELAIALGVSTVCIDEWRGRRAAASVGLKVTGSLGLLGRAKNLGTILAVRPWIDKLQAAGIFYHPELLASFLNALGE